MKILQVNCVFRKGSTGKIMDDIHKSLKNKEIESIICYGRGEKVVEHDIYKISSELEAKLNNLRSRLGGLQYGGSFIATRRLIKIIKREKPDIVHLHCINGFFVNIYRLLDFLKKNDVPTVLTLHAEFMYTGNCGHAYECDKWKTGCGKCPSLRKSTYSYTFDRTAFAWKKMKKAFDDFDKLIVTSVSPWLEQRSLMSPIIKDKKHTVIMNGVDCDVFYRHSDADKLKEKMELNGKKVLLFVTASFSSPVKGGNYIIELAKKLGNEYAVIVIGSRGNPNDLPNNMINLGRIENQDELAQYYSMADLSVIAGKKETFGMPVAESLCCGTPVVGFKAGGPEGIALSGYSEFVEYGDIDALYQSALKMINTEFNRNIISTVAQAVYSKEKMCDAFIKVYNRVKEI